MACEPRKNGTVILVEPNCVNINNDIVNGIPQYQDMYIFAELTAKSKGRTLIIVGENSNTTSTNSETINFIGNNQDNENENNPNYLNFTTNYYDGSTGNATHYEGFGINNIKIIINSSFIPQVNIQFIDIRGLAFFNQTKSPYRVLFDFPPPIFTLTVKGYYGKAITYELHLVKYTSEFSASNGNFIIDAQFVAVTFAPLTDILFRYVVNASMIPANSSSSIINDEESITPETSSPPKNTYELILKLKNLYAAIADKLETDTENKEYHSIQTQIETIDEIMVMLNTVINNENEVLNAEGKHYLVAKTPNKEYNLESTRASEQYNLQIIKSLEQFNNLIKTEETTGRKNNIKNKLFIVYIKGTNLPLMPKDYNPLLPEQNEDFPIYVKQQLDAFEYSSANYSGVEKALTTFGKNLLDYNLPAFNIQAKDIAKPEPFTNGKNIETTNTSETQYYGMNITEYYYKIYDKYQEFVEEKNVLSVRLAEKINNMVSQNLGMTPSIYNIFNVILGDVDKFFYILRKTSKRADEVHNKPISNKKIIANNNIDSPTSKSNIPDHIYPFPLIINKALVYGGTKKERIAPIELNKKVEFPELKLVEDFMDTFLLQRRISTLYDGRINQNDDGTYKWIPISPLDSVLGGATPESPYLNINDAVSDEILTILLKRFYILSQGSIYNSFYGEKDIKSGAYINLYANAEAINVVTTLISLQNADNVQVMADKYKNNIQGFYKYISGITTTYDNGTELVKSNLYKFPTNDPKYFPVTPSHPSEGKTYVDKNNPDFVGVNWYENEIIINNRTENEKSSKPIDNFNAEAKKKWWGSLIRGEDAEYNYFEFTQENVIWLRDIAADDNVTSNIVYDGLSSFSRYLTNAKSGFIIKPSDVKARVNDNFPGYKNRDSFEENAIRGQKVAYEGGNLTFKPTKIRDKRALKYGNNVVDTWSSELSDHDVVNKITGTTQNLASVIMLSNFGTTASPFNIYPNALNTLIFDTPAAIEVPTFYGPYLGALLTAIEDEWVDEILYFFTGTTGNDGIGTNFPNKGFNIFADLHDVEIYLSNNDKEKFKQSYHDFESNLVDIFYGIKEMVQYARENTGKDKMFLTESIGIRYQLNPTATKIKNALGLGQSYYLIQSVMERKGLINFSQITFEMINTYPAGYTSIDIINQNDDNKEANKRFFESFFTRLAQQIPMEKKKLKEQEDELKKAKGDVDIINQLYYSFKNINDKWLTGNANSNNYYPFNKPKKNLIDSFAFVDRAMNPIGDTILNAEILIDILDDPNISLFSVLTQLLSLNGFEFFPLQNFLSFDKNGWEDSFKIHTGGVYGNTSASFICMYVGGSSSYPSVSGNGFENDGIIDISQPGVGDYSTKKLSSKEIAELRKIPVELLDENQKQILSNSVPFQEVRAFRVRFGEQNQSMFTDIKIDSKEYPETNESIQILSRLAGDNNPDAPVPKGQNLYNLYENRSYKATVIGFGNAMIQPTQYFQLENIPLFNGAYIILTVEHNITANKMTTSFSGTKLLKYPVPRVLNPVAFTNFSPNQSAGNAVISAMAISNRSDTHYDAMYVNNFKIINNKKIEITLKI